MRNSQLILTLLSILISSIAFSQAGKRESIRIKTNIYCDHCKKCESCGPRIYNHLMDVPGIRRVKINEKEATVEVTYNSARIDPNAIRNALNAAGFDADDQPASAEAVAKLDECCKKE